MTPVPCLGHSIPRKASFGCFDPNADGIKTPLARKPIRCKDAFTGGDLTDLVLAGVGNDTLDGGSGSDKLHGGAGADTYTFTGDFGRDTVKDSDHTGSIILDGATLSGGHAAGQRNVWVGQDSLGAYEGYAVYEAASSSTGCRLVITRAGETANTITLDNFNLEAALSGSGYLGIKLDPTQKLALVQGTGAAVGASTANVWADEDFDETVLVGKSSSTTEGNGKSFPTVRTCHRIAIKFIAACAIYPAASTLKLHERKRFRALRFHGWGYDDGVSL
jgi:hypothetical protein